MGNLTQEIILKDILPELAVLLMDMQDLYLGAKKKLAIIPNQIEVLRFCKDRGIPVFLIEFEGDGPTRPELLAEIRSLSRKKYKKIYKFTDSAFCGTDLKQRLVKRRAKYLLIMGVNANACIYETVLEALEEGYIVIIAENLLAEYSANIACSNFKQWYKNNCIFYPDYKDIFKTLKTF